uniref:Uncharacterized protein n=1 Tax=Tanacetum cinerariifolium TaxID=118510 RepID=A0A699HJ47_TANCI|nr:hypothetical protein [Tanacetum cinerariifolium]
MDDSVEERLPEIISYNPSLNLPYLIIDNIKHKMPNLIKKALNSNVSNLLHQLLKIVHKDINALNKLETRRFSQQVIATRRIMHKNVQDKIGQAAKLFQISNKQMMLLISYMEKIMHSTIVVHDDLLSNILTPKNLTSNINKTSVDMVELVDLLTQHIYNNRL